MVDEPFHSDEPQPDEMPPATHGVYAVTRLIGSGGMGKVYEAYHTGLKKRVALKTLHGYVADRPEVVRRFLTEGITASRFSHPHVVTVTDVGEVDGLPYLVMEFLEGQSLAERIAAERRLSIEATADVLLPIIDAVATAHEHGIVHCDLKPENLFLATTPAGDVLPKVLDFGISRVARPSEPPSQRNGELAVVGTPAYMAPEQIRSPESVDARSDQYALGVVLFEAIAGTRPYDARPSHLMKYLEAVEGAERPALHDLRSDSPRELEVILRRALAGDPAERFESLRDFGAALLPFASKRSQTFWGPVYAELAAPVGRRTRQIALVTAAAAVTLAFAGWIWLSATPTAGTGTGNGTGTGTTATDLTPAQETAPAVPALPSPTHDAQRALVTPAIHRIEKPSASAEPTVEAPSPVAKPAKTTRPRKKKRDNDSTTAKVAASVETAQQHDETPSPSEVPPIAEATDVKAVADSKTPATAERAAVPLVAPPPVPAEPVKTKRDKIRTDNIDPWGDAP
jgi:eukaryotic-like serine/threonine-protein kinase